MSGCNGLGNHIGHLKNDWAHSDNLCKIKFPQLLALAHHQTYKAVEGAVNQKILDCQIALGQ